jgi:hypothetical protein
LELLKWLSIMKWVWMRQANNAISASGDIKQPSIQKNL